MMWSTDDDVMQAGANTIQSGNYLSPQQQWQMGQYANSLMAPQQIKGIGSGLASLGKAYVGGSLMNQAYPMSQQSQQPSSLSNIVSNLFGGGQPSASGDDQMPMQLGSANGGPSSLFSGLFGGSPPSQ